jgi:hopanoid C-2 methylase
MLSAWNGFDCNGGVVSFPNRRILCVFPEYSRSFGTLHFAYPFIPGVKAFMPPQGILAIASYLQKSWEVRFIDENIGRAKAADYKWADAVLVSGMHIQRPQINRINELAHGHGKLTVLGGPSVSAVPDEYPDFDILHIGELGDATDRLISILECRAERPGQQIRLETKERLCFSKFPIPAYHLISLYDYLLANIQFSSGCPYRCDFCDIPELYGRVPRHKSPQQVVAELDAMLKSGNPGALYFVDDNFASDHKALRELLPHLIDWQKRSGYPVELACEATLNLALEPDLLAMMREAYFCTVFCGIESPSPEALHSIAKHHNLRVPILDAIKTFNSYGLEVVSGIIMGLDGEPAEIGKEVLDLIKSSQMPMLTINLLYALPKTPLWRRLEREGRLLPEDPKRESNVEFLVPYEQVLKQWKDCILTAYDPDYLYDRFIYQMEHTYPNRIAVPNSRARLAPKNVIKGLRIITNLLIKIGLRGWYRDTFWRMAKPAFRRGDIEGMIHVGLVAHHLIEFGRECREDAQSAAFYSQKTQLPDAERPERVS